MWTHPTQIPTRAPWRSPKFGGTAGARQGGPRARDRGGRIAACPRSLDYDSRNNRYFLRFRRAVRSDPAEATRERADGEEEPAERERGERKERSGRGRDRDRGRGRGCREASDRSGRSERSEKPERKKGDDRPSGGKREAAELEHADADRAPVVVEYARRLGVDLEDLLVSQPDCGVQALEICTHLSAPAQSI
jgi:hypothetical protein